MIYNFNLGIGWASSGVEYAQVYRANCFRQAGIEARFLFTDMIRYENIEHLTANIGLKEEEVIWLYLFFTDQCVRPSSYPLSALEKSFMSQKYSCKTEKNIRRYHFEEQSLDVLAYRGAYENTVQRVEYICYGKLVRTEYYSDRKMFTEYFIPAGKAPKPQLRQFYNKDGSLAYEEIVDESNSIFRFPNQIFYSKTELLCEFIFRLHLTEKDVILLDRSTELCQPVLRCHKPARIGAVVHAEHYNKHFSDDQNILWNNHYEYVFTNADAFDFIICSTDAQADTLRKQLASYWRQEPRIVTIPVGSLKELKYSDKPRRKHAVLTASRLAEEKHIDWLIRATVIARKSVPDLEFDIYGKGSGEAAARSLIRELNAESYIHLCGHHNMTDIYTQYEAYISASGSEGFGLTLMEAVGSGLPIIGFDVPYGNITFIREGRNGYRINMDQDVECLVKELADRIVRLFTRADLAAFSEESYELAKEFRDEAVTARWRNLLEEDDDPAV